MKGERDFMQLEKTRLTKGQVSHFLKWPCEENEDPCSCVDEGARCKHEEDIAPEQEISEG
jgi:hypothetical protein